MPRLAPSPQFGERLCIGAVLCGNKTVEISHADNSAQTGDDVPWEPIGTAEGLIEEETDMLEHLPHWLGHAMRGVRSGHEKLAVVKVGATSSGIQVTSPAFQTGGQLPVWTTADGEGVSPPLAWGDAPEGTRGFAMIVEDPDAPTPEPLVHGIVWNLAAADRALPRGAIAERGGADTGLNSYGRTGWLPPDPPPGHGSHDHVFQLFAVSEPLALEPPPGRSEFLAALAGRVIAAGVLIGTWERRAEERVPTRSQLAT